MSGSSGSGGYHSFGTGSSISDRWESESEWSGLSGLVAIWLSLVMGGFSVGLGGCRAFGSGLGVLGSQ
jgi:hypothetical protein